MDLRWIAAILAVVAVAIGVIYYLRAPSASTPDTGAGAERPLKTYYDERYGIAFNFPDNYIVEEHPPAGGQTGEGTPQHTIVIGDKTAMENLPENGEGPPTMAITIFDNPAKEGTEKWIKGSNFSNYKLSPDGVLTTTAVAGTEALAYVTDGLYLTTNIVFPHRTYMVVLSVGQNSPEDQIVKDFARVVSSIQIDP